MSRLRSGYDSPIWTIVQAIVLIFIVAAVMGVALRVVMAVMGA